MAQLFSSQKQLVYPLFGRFNQEYGDALVTICPLLRKFEIDILTVEEYQALPEGTPLIEDITSQTFANFLQKDGDTADTTRAAIIYNATLIEQIGFTEPEQHAAIAHEIGHMLYFFLEKSPIIMALKAKKSIATPSPHVLVFLLLCFPHRRSLRLVACSRIRSAVLACVKYFLIIKRLLMQWQSSFWSPTLLVSLLSLWV